MANEKRQRSDPEYWQGTLLKCPACRLKFPFSATNQPFSFKEGQGKPVTRCPQCDGTITITESR